MQSRDAFTLIGALFLLAAAGVLFVGKDSMAEEVHPDAKRPAAPVPATAPVAEPEPATAVHAGADTVQIAQATASPSGKRSDAESPTSGIVRGDVQLAVSALHRIKTITIFVEEARRPTNENGEYVAPRKFTVPATMGVGTPTFEVTGIPFSKYPWLVTAYAPGLNGSRRTIVIDENTPVVEDVVLSITPGAPFTVLLRDQDQTPYTQVDVQLLPTGEPAGRAPQRGVSDNFGGVVFEDVLAGEYMVHVSQGGQELVEASRISMQPGAGLVSTRIQGQGHTVLIPRGVALDLRVSDINGYGLADAQASATAADKIKLTVLEKMSDHGGNLQFPYLTPGVWQIDVQKTDFQRSTRMVTIKPGEAPTLQEFQLVRLR